MKLAIIPPSWGTTKTIFSLDMKHHIRPKLTQLIIIPRPIMKARQINAVYSTVSLYVEANPEAYSYNLPLARQKAREFDLNYYGTPLMVFTFLGMEGLYLILKGDNGVHRLVPFNPFISVISTSPLMIGFVDYLIAGGVFQWGETLKFDKGPETERFLASIQESFDKGAPTSVALPHVVIDSAVAAQLG